MASSHHHTDAYMAAMYRALEESGVDTTDDPYKPSFTRSSVRSASAEHSLLAGALSRSRTVSPRALTPQPPPVATTWRRALGGTARVHACDASSRPLLCLSVHEDRAVVGSADHGLVELDVRPSATAPCRRRTLYSTSYGHSDWVTSVGHLRDGRVVSAGMDSKLCVWSGGGVPTCTEFIGHTGSISKALVSDDGTLIFSAAYDKTVRVWSASGGGSGGAGGGRGGGGGGGREGGREGARGGGRGWGRVAGGGAAGGASGSALATLSKHRAPVMHLASLDGCTIASADRDGCVIWWDLERGGIGSRVGAHRGHATALASAHDRRLLSGGQDGVVRLWDLRESIRATSSMSGESSRSESSRSSQARRVHTGAVNDVLSHQFARELVLSSGADGCVHVLEPRMSLRSIHMIREHAKGGVEGGVGRGGGFVYALAAVADVAVSGGGDGRVCVHSIRSGELVLEFQANQAAVRAIHVTPQRLVCAGDDGSVSVLHFDL